MCLSYTYVRLGGSNHLDEVFPILLDLRAKECDNIAR